MPSIPDPFPGRGVTSSGAEIRLLQALVAAQLVRRAGDNDAAELQHIAAIGAAQRVAVYLDRTDWPEIVGTLSGDDSIFIATRNASEQRRLVAKLRTQLNN